MSRDEDVAAIKAIYEQHVAAVNACDATATSVGFTEDAIFMPADQPAAIGRDSIRAWFQVYFDQLTDLSFQESPEEVEVADDWAFARSTFTETATPKDGGAPLDATGKTIVILKRQPDGCWKVHRACWNLDKPLPGASD